VAQQLDVQRVEELELAHPTVASAGRPTRRA